MYTRDPAVPALTGVQRGVSLVELIVSIVIVAVAVAGVLAALSMTTRASADPLVEKQALAIAQALLEEVQLMPFTYCDPDDPVAADAAAATDSSGGGAGGANDESRLPLGPEGAGATLEARSHSTFPFDNVSDYNGYDTAAQAPPGIRDITGTAIAGLEGYRATIAVAAQGIAAAGGKPAIAPADALLITVSVTGPANTSVVLQGYRTRHAPNALP
jgi:MSHA pilin protein MshD